MISKRTWTIEVFRATERVGRCEVPIHRLEMEDAKDMLRALVLKYEELELDEAVYVLLNKRRGGPQQRSIGDAQYFMDPDAATAGYWIHGPTVSACATYSLSVESCNFIRQARAQNRAAG